MWNGRIIFISSEAAAESATGSRPVTREAPRFEFSAAFIQNQIPQRKPNRLFFNCCVLPVLISPGY
jgi:hypothetical protein